MVKTVKRQQDDLAAANGNSIRTWSGHWPICGTRTRSLNNWRPPIR
jgi:hypothetical protein